MKIADFLSVFSSQALWNLRQGLSPSARQVSSRFSVADRCLL